MNKRLEHRSPEEAKMLAPDGTWGVIVVVLCTAMLAFLFFVPARAGASPSSKFYLAGFALIWMSSGIRQIRAAQAWKKRHSPQRPNQTMQRTSGSSGSSFP
jgi:hypothetical protein